MFQIKVFLNGHQILWCKNALQAYREEEVNKKLSQDRCAVTRATEDVIIDCLKEDELFWENLFNIVNSTLEREKLYYTKKKVKAENQQYEHSLEACAALRSKLPASNPLYIFLVNDKNMNGKLTFVFK